MDSKLQLITAFYSGLPKDRLKLETTDHGFPFLNGMLASGMTLEYGERVLLSQVHKYKFANVPGTKAHDLLAAHVRMECNICLYFKEPANNLFCFNLDKSRKHDDAPEIPETKIAVNLLRQTLAALGCDPLVVASGKGYHVWVRLSGEVDNRALFDFMTRAMARALFQLHQQGLDHTRINTRFYPDPRTLSKISLRLFGSIHVASRVFSKVLTAGTLLDEDASWAAFEAHLKDKTISPATFADALKIITAGQ